MKTALTFHERTMPDPLYPAGPTRRLGDYAVMEGTLCRAVVQTEAAARRLARDPVVLQAYESLKELVETIDRLGAERVPKREAARATLAALEGRTA